MSDTNVTIEGTSPGTRIVGTLLPHRDDAVIAWLRQLRDEHSGSGITSSAWYALDGAVDDYKLRADLGLSLTDEVGDEALR